MSKSFYKRLQVLLLRRWILIHVHETAIYRSEYPNPRSRNGGKNFWILSTACEQASDDTFPVSYLTKIEFYHTPEHLLNLKTSVLTLQKTRVFYNLCTEENFIRNALSWQWHYCASYLNAFREQVALTTRTTGLCHRGLVEGDCRFMAKNLWVRKNVIPLQTDEKTWKQVFRRLSIYDIVIVWRNYMNRS